MGNNKSMIIDRCVWAGGRKSRYAGKARPFENHWMKTGRLSPYLKLLKKGKQCMKVGHGMGRASRDKQIHRQDFVQALGDFRASGERTAADGCMSPRQ